MGTLYEYINTFLKQTNKNYIYIYIYIILHATTTDTYQQDERFTRQQMQSKKRTKKLLQKIDKRYVLMWFLNIF